MRRIVHTLRARLGDLAIAALALISIGLVFLFTAVRPLEARLKNLEESPGLRAPSAAGRSMRSGAPEEKLATFYAHFDRPETPVEWLAKLYGSALAAGIELRTAEYRLVDTRGRLVRYEATLPLSGSYVQVRSFLEYALSSDPLLSLDGLRIRRKRVNDSAVEAEAVVTIHLLRP